MDEANLNHSKSKYLSMHPYQIWYSDHRKRWCTYLPDKTHYANRRLVSNKSEEKLKNTISKYYLSLDYKEPSVKDVFYLWINEKRHFHEIQKNTADRYETDFQRFFNDIMNEKIYYFDEDMLEDFIREQIYNNQLTAKSWNNLRILINGIWKYAKRKKYTTFSISNFMSDLQISSGAFKKTKLIAEEQVFTNKEVQQITSWIQNGNRTIIRLGILFAFHTGLRAGELSALKWSDFNGDLLTVQRTEIRYRDEERNYIFEVRPNTKGRDGYRKVILSDKALEIAHQIHQINPNGKYMFMNSHGERIKGKAFSFSLIRLCNTLGLTPRSLHKARKTYASNLLRNNVDEKLIIRQMGHTNIETTRDYYYYDNHSVEEAKQVLKYAITY